MKKVLEKQLSRLVDLKSTGINYTFTELNLDDIISYHITITINNITANIQFVYQSNYPFSPPYIRFENLHLAAKHPLLNYGIVKMCDFNPAMDIKAQIIQCYIIFSELLVDPNNEDLLEIGEIVLTEEKYMN